MSWRKRLRNKGLWVSAASLVLLVLKASGVPVVEEQYNEIVTAILTIAVAAGLINNPDTENAGFSDDK